LEERGGVFASDFLDVKMTQEYNAGKHGLRTKPGGFYLQIGREPKPGVAPSPEKMMPISGSVFGTSAFIPKKIIDNNRINLRPCRQAMNWDPQNLAKGLVLLSMSINNVVSFLRIKNGAPGNKCKFFNPDSKDQFDAPWGFSAGYSSIGMDTVIHPSDIKAYDKKDVIDSYEKQKG